MRDMLLQYGGKRIHHLIKQTQIFIFIRQKYLHSSRGRRSADISDKIANKGIDFVPHCGNNRRPCGKNRLRYAFLIKRPHILHTTTTTTYN